MEHVRSVHPCESPSRGQLAIAPTGKILRGAGAMSHGLPCVAANHDRIISETSASHPQVPGPANRVGYLCAFLAFAGAAVYASSTPVLAPSESDSPAANQSDVRRASLLSQAKEVAQHYSNATYQRAVYEYVPQAAAPSVQQPAAIKHAVLHIVPKSAPIMASEAPNPKRRSAAMTLRVENIIKYYAPKGVDPKPLASRIVRESERQGYDPLFVAAVIKSESMFNTMARSHVGARGLMQIMPATGRWLAGKHSIDRLQLHDSEQNLKLGIAYLKELEAEYNGDKVMTLVAYNWGPGHVQMAGKGKRRIPGEVMRYAVKILNDYRRWRGDAAPLRAIG